VRERTLLFRRPALPTISLAEEVSLIDQILVQDLRKAFATAVAGSAQGHRQSAAIQFKGKTRSRT
jgi:hypothetical protein